MADKDKSVEEKLNALTELLTKSVRKADKSALGQFENLLAVFSAFSNIKWVDVFFGITAMNMAIKYLPIMGKAIDVLKNSIVSKGAEKTVKVLLSFVDAIETFGNIRWGSVMFGLFVLGLLSAGMAIFAVVGPVMIVGAKLFQVFAGIMGKAIGAFFKALPFAAIVKGLLLLGGLAIALALLAGAFILFSLVSWSDVFIGLGAIAAFAVLAAVLGAAIAFIAPGILVLAGLGLALIVFGGGLMMVGKGLEFMADGISAIADTLPAMADTFSAMAGMSVGLLATAAALAVLSVAIVAFSAATAAGNIGGAVAGAVSGVINWMSGSTSTSPIDQLARLAAMSEPLNKTADALERINAAIRGMPSKAGADLSMLAAQGAELSSQRGVASAGGGYGGGGGKNVAATTNNKVSSVIVNNGYMPDRSTALVLAYAM